jgi:2',3'-cyclic-nucleotide 2'-phosphodiesterase (5'-nucleotidase family)
VARRATRISQERKKGGALLVLDAGNSLVGDQDPALRTQGQSSVVAMNMMGYDAMTLGQKDLALGLDVLRQRIAEAEFAVLSANAVVSPTGEWVATPYVLRQVGDQQVAIIGLSGGKGTSEITVLDPLETAQTVVARVARQADAIILLSHAGALTDQQIAETVPGIGLIVSGGQFKLSTPWRSEKMGTLIVHADQASRGHAGRVLGIARLTFDTGGRLVQQKWQGLNLSPDVTDDPEMTIWVQQQTVQ